MSEMLLSDLYLLDDKSFENKYKCIYPKFKSVSPTEEEHSWIINWDLILPKLIPAHYISTTLSYVLQRVTHQQDMELARAQWDSCLNERRNINE